MKGGDRRGAKPLDPRKVRHAPLEAGEKNHTGENYLLFGSRRVENRSYPGKIGLVGSKEEAGKGALYVRLLGRKKKHIKV